MVCKTEPVVVNDGKQIMASILSQWICIMVCYSELVGVVYGVLY